MEYPRSSPFSPENHEGVQQHPISLHPPPDRWGFSLPHTLEGRWKGGDGLAFPFQQGFQVSPFPYTSQSNSRSLVSFSYLGCCSCCRWFSHWISWCVRVGHSLFTFGDVFPKVWFSHTIAGVYCSAPTFSWDYSCLSGVLDYSFQAYGPKWFLGLAFRNHSGHITVVEQASAIQPMWRKGSGKEVIFKAQTEAHQSPRAGESPAWKALISNRS